MHRQGRALKSKQICYLGYSANSSPQFWLADCDLSFIHLTNLPPSSYSKTKPLWRHNWFVAHYIQDNFFVENVNYRQIAKNRQIAKPSTRWMQALLRMIPIKYKKNLFKTLRVVAFWRKVYELTKQINKQINKQDRQRTMTQQSKRKWLVLLRKEMCLRIAQNTI